VTVTGSAAHTPSYGEVDLTTCDREPIQIPGAIQPHGVLLALDTDLVEERGADLQERVTQLQELAARTHPGSSLDGWPDGLPQLQPDVPTDDMTLLAVRLAR
jgi:PAS fold